MPEPVRITKTIDKLERIYGAHNPRFLVTMTDGTQFKTSPNAMFAYEIENSTYRGIPVEFTLSRGQIAYGRVVK